VDPLAGEAEDRRQERDRDQHRDRDRACGREAHDRQERDVDHGQPHERDHDGQTGENDGTTGGRGRPRGGFLDVEPVGDVLAVAREDEQRVVDPDREAEHRRQDGSGLGLFDHARQRRQPSDADRNADDRRDERQAGGEQRAERDREHEVRDHHPGSLGVRLLGLADDPVAELNRQPGRAGGRRHFGELVLGAVADLVGRNGVDHVAVADTLVLRQRVRLERIDDRGDLVGILRERHRLVDGLPVGRVGQRLALRRDEHHSRRGSARATELLVEKVLRTLRFGARDLELVVRLSLEGEGADAHGGKHEHPRRQHLPAIRERPAA
jgi:hypothetical protein